MIVVVVPEEDVNADELDYSGGIYKYAGRNVKEAFRQFVLDLIDELNQLYEMEDRKPIHEIPSGCTFWKPTLSAAVINKTKGYLTIRTPSKFITYDVYAYSDASSCLTDYTTDYLYSWRDYGFEDVFNDVMKEQHLNRYVCRVFSSDNYLETKTLYAKDVSDFRAQLDNEYNPCCRLKHVSTSDKSATSFGELFYDDDNRLMYAIMAEEKND